MYQALITCIGDKIDGTWLLIGTINGLFFFCRSVNVARFHS